LRRVRENERRCGAVWATRFPPACRDGRRFAGHAAIYNSIIPGRMVTAELEPVTVESRRPWLAAHNPQTRPVWVLEDESTKGWRAG